MRGNRFLQKKLAMNGRLDFDKMFIAGQGLGGWTSILASLGNLKYFKASLSLDPDHLSYS